MSATPRTDAEEYPEPITREPVVEASVCRQMERELNEAHKLCRWAFPRLRAMCHDFDAGDTGWVCAEEMENHPEIFTNTPKYQ